MGSLLLPDQKIAGSKKFQSQKIYIFNWGPRKKKNVYQTWSGEPFFVNPQKPHILP